MSKNSQKPSSKIYSPEIDYWRSVWVALAIADGQDPDKATEGHKRLCKEMGWK